MFWIGLGLRIVVDSFGGTREPPGPDITAPILTLASGVATGGTTASASVFTSESTGTLYQVTTTSATPPTKAQVKAGQNHLGAAAVFVATPQAVVTSGLQVISGGVTGLTSESNYYNHFMHEDTATNLSNVASSALFTTFDVTAPVLSNAVATAIDETNASASVDTTEGDGTIFYTVSYYSTPPDSTQIMAGLEYNGDPAPFSGTIDVVGPGGHTIDLSALETDTLYVVHWFQRDSDLNPSNIISSNDFTPTAQALPLQSYFGTRYFGPVYFGDNYFRVNFSADYYGNRYFGPAYFGNNYFAKIKDTNEPADELLLLLIL